MDGAITYSPHQTQFFAWELTRRISADSVESLGSTLVDAQVDLNPHQVEAALFACRNPLSRGVILADEVGLGKTIEAGLVLAQFWAERIRRVLIIVPANLRKQWHQELKDKFALQGQILESKRYNQQKRDGSANPFDTPGPVICSYQFAKTKIEDLRELPWDIVVFDEAHRLRNVYKPGNVIANTLKDGLAQVPAKVLLTATPLQNSLLELFGLVSVIDERVFGDLDSFRRQFGRVDRPETFQALRHRIAPLCKRTLREQVAHTISYTNRIPIVQEFTPSQDEQHLRALVADYLRRPDLQALGNSQRQLISLVLWKLLASSTHAIGGALGTMATRLERLLAAATEAANLTDTMGQDYEALSEASEEDGDRNCDTDGVMTANKRQAIAKEIAELRRHEQLAKDIRNNAKGEALLTALARAFKELDRLGAPRKALIFTESRRTQDYLLSLLADTDYGHGIVLFNGSNSGPEARRIYGDWLALHAGSDRITGSRTADTRAALVEHFRDQGTVMIATEAGAEGINLQFCSLVINYDLPWNPQRVEQRIGCCHRYGQGFDVVVVNFIDRSNEADRRVYELPRRSGDAHLYRLGHPLGEYLLGQAKSRALDPVQLLLDYDAYPKRLSTLEPWRGSRGTLVAELVTIDSLAGREQCLLAAAITDDGRLLTDDDPRKLLRLPVSGLTPLNAPPQTPPALSSDLERRRQLVAQGINERNLRYFQQETEKLDAWADDLKVGLEQEIKELDRQIKEVRRAATTASTLEEKLGLQKQQRELEQKRGRMRRELFQRQDEIENKRNELITDLEAQLQQRAASRRLFSIEWELIE